MSIRRRLVGGFRSLRTVDLDHLGRAVRPMLVVALVVTAATCVMVVLGFRGPTLDAPPTQLEYHPLVLPWAILAGGVAAVLLALAAVRSAGAARILLSVCVLTIVLLAVAQLPNASNGWVWIAASLAVAALGLVDLTRRGGLWSVGQSVAVAAPFVATAILVASSSGLERAFAALNAASLIPYTTAALAVLVCFSLASALQARHEQTAGFVGRPRSARTLLIVLTVKAVVLVALFAGLGWGTFGGEAMWRARLDQPLSWLHALIVAALVVGVALRSQVHPLEARAFSPSVVILALLSSVSMVVFLLAMFLASLGAATDPTSILKVADWTIDHSEAIGFSAALAILVLGLAVVVGIRQWRTGPMLWLIAGVWLVPPMTGILLVSAGHDPPTFWASPAQVDTVITICVAVLAATMRARLGDTRILLRLLVIPAVVIHGGSLLPEAWASEGWRLLVVGSVILAILAKAPKVASDRRRNERTLSALIGSQLLLVTAYFVIATSDQAEGFISTASNYVLLWLAVPVAGVLVARVIAPAPAGSTPPPLWRRRLTVTLHRLDHRRPGEKRPASKPSAGSLAKH